MNIKYKIDNLLYKMKLRAFFVAIKTLKVLEMDHGHFKSSNTRESVNGKGPVPWFTYPAIDYLNQLDLSDKKVFEFGSGNSTIYWGSRCKKVISVEDDGSWYEKILDRNIHKNVKLLLRTEKISYLNTINKYKADYDIVVIDGSHRYDCTKTALKKIKIGGLIIIDNSDQYPKACENLRNNGFIQADFCGFGPINPHTWCTSFFFDKNYNFSPRWKNQPDNIPGSIKKIAKS